MQLKPTIKCSILTLTMLLPIRAWATPRELPFTYPVETLPQGSLELEMYGDMTPLRVYANPSDPRHPPDLSQGRLWEPAYQLQNEFEYGLTDSVELGFYQVFVAKPAHGGSNALTFDGMKWRVRGRFADTGQWPIDVGWYAELETKHDELSLEGKVLLAKRWGRLHWMANLWVEASEQRPFDENLRSFHFILNPTTGVAYQVTPTFHPGKCASCPMAPEPQSRTRSEVVSARMRHRNRVRLTDEEWDAMTDYLATPDGTAVRVAR